MISRSPKHSGYVLVSVTVVLLSILSAILVSNSIYTTDIVTAESLDPIDRAEIEKNALAHLQAYAEQKNCTATPDDITVSGTKDNLQYSLSWNRTTTGTTLRGSYNHTTNSNLSWTSEQNQVELYGETQSTTWVLAPYFSAFVEIKDGKKDQHHVLDSGHDMAKVKDAGEIVLRSFKLGPLATEPLQFVAAGLELFMEEKTSLAKANALQLHAIRYPWDSKTATDGDSGVDNANLWKEQDYSKFEALDTNITLSSQTATIDFTQLMGSWLSKSRSNYGWAMTSTNKKHTKWVSGYNKNAFEQRPKMHIKYRCACGQACVGMDQNEAVALGTLNPVHGYGGGNDKMTKLWLHRTHPEYLTIDTAKGSDWGRDHYEPAGLSEFAILGLNGDEEITGAHIEPANADHEHVHYYTITNGKSVNTMAKEQAVSGGSVIANFLANAIPPDLANSGDKLLIYYQSPANKPIGESLAFRSVPNWDSGTQGGTPAVSNYIPEAGAYVGGFSMFDQRYWFGQYFFLEHRFRDIPVKDYAGDINIYHKVDNTRASLNLEKLDFDTIHTIDAIHVIDQYNVLLSGEWISKLALTADQYDSEMGQLSFHDGDIVLYNTITQTARLINGDISRSIGNNISAIAWFKEPMPSIASPDNDDYKASLPFMFD